MPVANKEKVRQRKEWVESGGNNSAHSRSPSICSAGTTRSSPTASRRKIRKGSVRSLSPSQHSTASNTTPRSFPRRKSRRSEFLKQNSERLNYNFNQSHRSTLTTSPESDSTRKGPKRILSAPPDLLQLKTASSPRNSPVRGSGRRKASAATNTTSWSPYSMPAKKDSSSSKSITSIRFIPHPPINDESSSVRSGRSYKPRAKRFPSERRSKSPVSMKPPPLRNRSKSPVSMKPPPLRNRSKSPVSKKPPPLRNRSKSPVSEKNHNRTPSATASRRERPQPPRRPSSVGPRRQKSNVRDDSVTVITSPTSSSYGGSGTMKYDSNTNTTGKKGGDEKRKAQLHKTMVIIWMLMAAELGFDMATTFIAFASFLVAEDCCGYEIELGTLSKATTIPFLILVLIEMAFLGWAIILTLWPSLEYNFDNENNGHNAEEGPPSILTRCLSSKFGGFLKWNARKALKAVHLCTVINPFLSCLVAWVLIYEGDRTEALVVLGLEAGAIVMHCLSVYLEGGYTSCFWLVFHSLPFIPFIVTVSLSLVYLKQGGVCYLVDKGAFLFHGCEVCDDGTPPIDGMCGNETISGGNLLDSILGVDEFSELTARNMQATYCSRPDDPIDNNFCWYSY